MIDDFEKNRAEYVARLEQDLINVRRERDEFKAIADKYKITVYVTQVFAENNTSFLQAVVDVGGKRLSTRIPASTVYAYKNDQRALVMHVAQNFVASLVTEQIVVDNESEFKRIADNMNALFVKGMIV